MNLFSSLGIDWQTLIVQIVAFVILVVLVGRFVVPVLVRSVDARQAAIDASVKAAQEAQALLEGADAKAKDHLREAREQASGILATAKEEATAAIESARTKAVGEAERIVSDAQVQIRRDVDAARKTLRNDAIDLVASATEKVAAVKIDAKSDARTIESALSAAGTRPAEAE